MEANLCEFQAITGYTRLIQKQIQVVVVYTFNLSVWESHTFNPSTGKEDTETGTIFWEERGI